MSPPPSTRRKLFILSTLYFVQGLPYGFQGTALPTYLRQSGLSLTAIGFLGALALPWSFKAFLAPLVEIYYLPRIGRRRSWILPMQAGLGLTCLVASLVPLPAGVPTLLGLVFLMNVFAATMDIAVDGLAVDLLDEHELGYGNSSQVVGYKVGMLTGGGLLIYAAGELGWGVLLSLMAGIVALIFLFTLTWSEPAPREEPAALPGEPAALARSSEPAALDPSGDPVPPAEPALAPRRSLGGVMDLVFRALKLPGAGWFLLYIATYKIGEGMVDVMFKPFLIDRGVTPQQVGLWLGTYGMVASITGSLAGGWAASRLPMWWALMGVTALRVIPMIGEWWVAVHPSTDTAIIALTALEHLFGGALTTIVFAFMMSRVDARIGATHYTLLATIEVLGKSPGTWASGKLAETMGYGRLFALGAALSFAVLLVLWPLRHTTPGWRGAGERAS